MAPQTVLCLNPGSSSLRYAVYECDGKGETMIASGHVEHLHAQDPGGLGAALDTALGEMSAHQPSAIAYRVVHGGDLYSVPTLIDDTVMVGLRSLGALAPEHMPAAIATIGATRDRFPKARHVACFDTAFHQRAPEVARRFALPRELWDAGVRRYGFHGLSFEYVLQSLGDEVPERTIIAHLGNGSSLVALRSGEAIDTTMGMTPAGGMMMGSRSGDLDPGVLIHLMRERRLAPDQLDRMINQESGLKGVSDLSSDMKTLLAKRAHCSSCAMAVEMYCHHARKQIGALAAVLGGLDLLVFTGGIGENSDVIRDEICVGLEFLDCEVKVVPTDETRMLARHAMAVGS